MTMSMQQEYIMNKQKWQDFSDHYQQVFEDIQDGPTIQLLKLLHFIRSHVEQSEMELDNDNCDSEYINKLHENAYNYKWEIDGDSMLLFYLAIQIRSKIDNPFGFSSDDFESQYLDDNSAAENPYNGICINELIWLTKDEIVLVQRCA